MRGPCTAQEVFRALGCDTNQSGRFTELRELGVFEEVGVRECQVTGRDVIEWDVTSSLPLDVLNKKSPTEELRGLVRKAYRILKEQEGKPDVDEFLEGARQSLRIPDPKPDLKVAGGAPASVLKKLRRKRG